MKKFCLVSLAVVGLCAGSCTESDRFFGNDLVPPSQQMTTRIDTLMPLSTYQITFDSVSGRIIGSTASAVSPLGYVGSVIDPFVGRTTVGTLANFTPDAYTKNEEWKKEQFGVSPTFDSMKLSVAWNIPFAVGDTAQKFKVSVYALNKRLHSGTTYYTCFDPTGSYDPTKPVAEFTTNGLDAVNVMLPKWYSDQFFVSDIIQAGEGKPYSSDSVFLDMFNGLYFHTDPVAPGSRGAIGAIALSNSELRLHYHNKGYVHKGDGPDTTSLGYFFYYVNPDNAALYYTPYNTSFVIAQHDYSLATDPRRVDPAVINNWSVPCATGFVQGLGGLAVVAKVDMEAIEGLKAKAATEGYKYVGVHRAELRWRVPERTLFYYDDSFALLVMGNWIDSRSGLTPLADYNPWNSSSGANAMGGDLLRSVGYYSQNITSYIQQLLSGVNTNGELLLLPDFGLNRDNLDPLRSVVGGSAGPETLRPELIVTYTLIR